MKKILIPLIVFSLLMGMISCSPRFSQFALTQDTNVKTEAVNLFNHSTESYANHQKEADTLLAHINQALVFEQNRKPGNNKIGVKMWQTLTDSNQALVQNLAYWKAHTTLSAALQPEVSTKVGQMFDQIIALENSRPKP